MAAKKTTEVTVETVETVTEDFAVATVEETSYTKEQIISSKRFNGYVDILNTVLGNRKYTFTEVDGLLKEFLNKEVD